VPEQARGPGSQEVLAEFHHEPGVSLLFLGVKAIAAKQVD
jgi:hypothetical protein